MRNLAVYLAVIVGVAQVATASDAKWLTDLAQAQAEAKKSNKLVLLDFNGSDWCPPCLVLKKEVFASPEFQTFAKQNLVLVDLDFPQNKPQPEKLKAANQALAAKFGVEGLPTVVILGSDGKELDKKSGYEGESPKEFVAKLEKLRQKVKS